MEGSGRTNANGSGSNGRLKSAPACSSGSAAIRDTSLLDSDVMLTASTSLHSSGRHLEQVAGATNATSLGSTSRTATLEPRVHRADWLVPVP